MFSTTLLAATLLTVGASVEPAAPSGVADSFAIKASAVHIGDGTSIENGVVVIEGGKVKSVGTAAPDGMKVIEVEGHVSPGLIALRDSTGATRERTESTRKFTPSADLARAFDPDHPDWRKVVAQGITAVVLTPGSGQIAGGTAALVSPATGEVLKRGAAVSLGMSSRSFSFGVEPTSYAGLYAHLEKAFAEAPADSAMASAKAGKTPVLMEARSRIEALRAIDFAKGHGLSGAIVGLQRGEEILPQLKESGLAVVLESFGPGASPAVLDAAKEFAKEGVPFAFTADSESRGPAALRMTAAALMRRGLDSKSALMAMTSTAADVAGVGATHGTIAKGMAADLVVWGGEPTDLTSRVLHVFAAGSHVFDASKENAR